ncbi:MAG TPA: 4-hydroxy-tetrahydrodipicolinate synthase [Thermoanaerobaculia bacterium]|nr:4-hydroxy-tetrahydrodipicolinate synthase [Thermoanaerobaculia bacterium]
MKFELRGSGTALVTPFDERGRIDFAALESLVNWQISEGIDFLVTCTPEGESPALSGDERRALTAHVVKIANGRVPVVAGAGGNHTAKSVFWARDAMNSGASAILSVTPSYNLPSPEGLFRHFTAISDATRLPIVLYNVPARTGEDLDSETILRLAQIPRIAALAEASTNFRKLARLLPRLPPDFAVYSADDATALGGLGLGMKGLISTAANEIPGPIAQMVRAAMDDRSEEARAIHQKYFSLIDVNHCERSPGPVKAALAMLGRCGETLRLPLAPVREDSRRRIEKVLRNLKLAGRAGPAREAARPPR